MQVEELLGKIQKLSEADEVLIRKAFSFAERAHDGVKRYSGEPYFVHPFETAKNLAGGGAEVTTIVATLLHDSVDDGSAKFHEIDKDFGKEIGTIVRGISELGQIKYRGTKRHVESLRKLIVLISKDIRIAIVKFAERINNLETLQFVQKEKQKRIALESIEVYAAVADRLGMGRTKATLEDLAFPYINKEGSERTKKLIEPLVKNASQHLRKFEKDLAKKLISKDVKNFTLKSRTKHLYSTYKKNVEIRLGP